MAPQQHVLTVIGGETKEPVYQAEEIDTIFPEEREGWRGYIEWEKSVLD